MNKERQLSMIKTGFMMLGTIIGNKLGILAPAMLLLIFLMMVDYVSGMLASKKEAVEYPNDYAGCNNNSACALDESPSAVPCCANYILRKRCMVSRKLHNKRCRLTCKCLEFLENNSGYYNRCNTNEICCSCYPCAAVKQRCSEKTDNGSFCAANHKACGHYCHLAVALRLYGA